MKKELRNCPKTINESELYGFSWMEHVLAIPSPLVVVTTYKENGLPNATMQSWCTFDGQSDYHIIFGNVSKKGHMYQTIKEKGCCVVNIPRKEVFLKCMDTVKNNQFEQDEITSSGLTSKKASLIDAPLIEECMVNLECTLAWEHDLIENSPIAVLCLKVVNIWMEESLFDEEKQGRYGTSGYLYNIHSPRNPLTGKAEETYVGILNKYKTYEELEKENKEEL